MPKFLRDNDTFLALSRKGDIADAQALFMGDL